MGYKVEITDFANSELEEIVRYMVETLENSASAKKLLDDFSEKKSILYDNPYSYALCPIKSLQRKGYRRFIFMKNYVALYLIDDDENNKVVTIMHIFYAKRNYEMLV